MEEGKEINQIISTPQLWELNLRQKGSSFDLK
jgi:hypothetical protein